MRNSECVMRNDEAARGGEVWPAAMGSALLRGMGWGYGSHRVRRGTEAAA